MKKQITKQEYLILVALMHLGREHNRKMNEFWIAINELLEDEGDTIGWFILEEKPFNTGLLEKMGIEVVE